MPEPDKLTVALGARSYDIVIGEGVLAGAGGHIAAVAPNRPVVVVTDENVAALHLATVRTSLTEAGVAAREIVVPPGEHTKDFEHLEWLIDRLLEPGISRDTLIVALGGGVVGDLAGFAAAIVLRGLDFAQLPTTLLAQVDSSVGGKTGINTRVGKNLVGSFPQPVLVLADTDVLDTLPRRELLAGYAEVVKYGLIDDAEFFAWLESNGAAAIAGDAAARRYIIATCCAAKARVVAEDERETGRRVLLNLGHTFAHALEAEAGFGDELLHGEAVAIGIVMAFELSVRMNLCAPKDLARVQRHFESVGLAIAPPASGGRDWDAHALLAHMAHDKKAFAGRPTFVLARGIGQAFLQREVDTDQILDVLEQAAAA